MINRHLYIFSQDIYRIKFFVAYKLDVFFLSLTAFARATPFLAL